MSKKSRKSKLIKFSKRSRLMNLRGLAFVLVFAVAGVFVILKILAAAPPALFEPPNGKVYIGVSTDHNVSTGGSDRLAAFDSAAGIIHPAIFNQYTTQDGSFSPTIANATQGPVMTPMVSWNLPFNNSQVTNGSQDGNIAARIAEVKTFGKPIFIRLDWEFNGTWYPGWNNPQVTPAQYVASWQYVVTKFKQAGITNAAFVWCPNVGDYFNASGTRFPTSLWYPGDAYVDWVGLDAYPQSNTKATLLYEHDGMNQMAQFAAAHSKPLALTEWALNTPYPDDPTVIDWVLAWQNSYPDTVKANMWFDFSRLGKDFTLIDHPLAAAEYRAKIDNNPEYLFSVVNNSSNQIPPVISAVTSSNVTISSATITWATNEASTSQIQYGPTTAYGTSTTQNTNLVNSHSISLSGLASATTYHYRVLSTNNTGQTSTSSNYTILTLTPAPAPPPTAVAGPIIGIGSKCVDDKYAQFVNGNTIWLYSCNGSVAQRWTLPGDGTIRLDNNSYCLSVQNASTKAGTLVILNGCNGSVAQRWVVNSNSSIVNPNSNMCLDDEHSGVTDGNPIWIYSCNGSSAQKWSIPKV